jgi:two-component system nitrate/nitrite response regulator NarL
MKLLVVDDHPVLREGLATLLRQIGPDTAVLEAADAAEALMLVAKHADLDVVVLDIVMPGLDGLRAIAEFGRARPELPVIVLSSSEDAQTARQALAQGALGYVPKSASRHTLLSAIRLVLSGELYVPPLILDETPSPRTTPVRKEPTAGAPALTERQIEVLRLIGEGRTNLTIAQELGLSEKTVKGHVAAIFKAMDVLNRTQAAAVARQSGLI